MSRAKWLLLGPMLVAVGTSAAAELRLAGTMQTPGRGWQALVVVNGEQRWVRATDQIDGGTVTVVADRLLRIHYPKGEAEYRLGADGSARPPAGPTGPPVGNLDGLMGSISADAELVDDLGKLAVMASSHPRAEVQAEFNKLLALPPTARLVGADPSYELTHREAPLAQSLTKVSEQLAAGAVPHLVVLDEGRITTMYVVPPPPAPAGTAPP